MYVDGKQTIQQLATQLGVSESTIKRRLREIECDWKPSALSGGGFVHLDMTYLSRNEGVLCALDSRTGEPLHLEFVKSETTWVYDNAIKA